MRTEFGVIQVRRCSFRRNLTGTGLADEGRKSMTLSCGDSKDHSARLLSEIAQQIRKRLKIRRKKKVQTLIFRGFFVLTFQYKKMLNFQAVLIVAW